MIDVILNTMKLPSLSQQLGYSETSQYILTSSDQAAILTTNPAQVSEMLNIDNKALKRIGKFHNVMLINEFCNIVDERSDENAVLVEQVKAYEQKNAELLARFQKLKEDMKARKINTFEALAQQDKEAVKLLIELAQLTEPMPLEGRNIAAFGLTSAGKSTLINAFLEQNVAITGYGETTMQITPYPAKEYTLWDVPGNNDEILYITMEYISFFKGLTKRLVMIQSTIKENLSLIKLFDEINLEYDIVVSKFDLVEESEQQNFKDQIQREVATLQLKKLNKIFYISAKYRERYPDWQELIKHLTSL